MYFKRSDKGFTLIELLVVIAIIGILSTVVLASLNSARMRSRDARRVSDLKQMQIALELYFDAQRTYVVAAQGNASTVLAPLVAGGHIGAIPFDPLNSPGAPVEYQYYGSSATQYCLGADMEGTIPTPADSCQTNLTTAREYMVGP